MRRGTVTAVLGGRRGVRLAVAGGLVAALVATPAPATAAAAPNGLAGVKARLDELAEQHAAPREVTAWWADPATGSVVLALTHAPRDARGATWVTDARRVDPRVRLVEGAAPLTPRAGLVGGDPIYLGGARCSVGFVARTATGAVRMITAGHCTKSGGPVRGADNQLIGPTHDSTFDREGDWGTVDVTGPTWAPTAQVAAAAGGTVTVTGPATARVGAPVCRSGSTTGWHCGQVTALDVTANYDTGPVLGLTMTSACSEPGDSGGPFVSGTAAVGTLSGGSGDCRTPGGDTLYQPITETLRREGLTLVTP